MKFVTFLIYVIVLGLFTYLHDSSVVDSTIKPGNYWKHLIGYIGIICTIVVFTVVITVQSGHYVSEHKYSSQEYTTKVDTTIVKNDGVSDTVYVWNFEKKN